MEKYAPTDIIFVNGPNHTGKDTFADALVEENPDMVKISTGDLIRETEHEGHRFSDIITADETIAIHESGVQFPDEIVVDLVKAAMAESAKEGKTKFVFTAFPKTAGQLAAVDEMMQQYEAAGTPINTVFLAITATRATLEQNLQTRREQAIAQGREPRTDDTSEKFEPRLAKYRAVTAPVLRGLIRDRVRELHIVNATNKSREEVFSEAKAKIGYGRSMVKYS